MGRHYETMTGRSMTVLTMTWAYYARAVQPLPLPPPLPLTLTLALTVCQGCAGASALGFAYGGALLTTPSPRLLELAVSPPAGEHATFGLLP